MSDAFNTALHRATQLSRQPEQKISIGIQLGMAGGGGLSSIPKRMNVKGEPHHLAYLNSDKASFLKRLGGSGRPINGIPTYIGVTDQSAESYDTDVSRGGAQSSIGHAVFRSGPTAGYPYDPGGPYGDYMGKKGGGGDTRHSLNLDPGGDTSWDPNLFDPPGPWDEFSPPELQRKYKPIPQDVTVTYRSPGIMESYFRNLAEEDEEEGHDRLYGKEGGGISSIQKRMNIKGEPHQLAYINPDKASLLRQMGGSGKSVNGVPAYFGVGYSDADAGVADPTGVGLDEATRGEGYRGTGEDVSREAWENMQTISEKEAALRKEEENKASIWDYFNIFGFSPRTEREIKERQNEILDKMGAAGNFSGRISISGMGRGGNTNPGGSWIGRKEGGGLSSVQKQIDIDGEPHRLSYINSDEASLLKQLGGSGRNVNGVPAYFGVGYSDADAGYSDPGDASSDSQDIDEAAPTSPQAQADADALAQATQADPSGLESGLLSAVGPGYASGIPSLIPEAPQDLDFIGPLTSAQDLEYQRASYFGTPITIAEDEMIQEKIAQEAAKKARDAEYTASAAKERSKIPDRDKDPEAHKAYIEAEMAAKKESVEALNRFYWADAPVLRLGIDILESKHEKIAGSPDIKSITEMQKDTGTDNPFFGVEHEDGTIDWYGPLGRQKDEEDTWEFWQPNPLAYALQSQTVHGVGAPKTYEEYMDISEAGIPSSAMGIMDPEAPESYFHAQQLVLQEMLDAREKEEKELDEENEKRRSLGWIELDKPEGGWKTVDPEKYDDPFTTGLYGVSALMRQFIPLLGAINFAQRMGGSGEHGMEIQGIEDKIAGGQALGALTGYHGPSLSRESREYEKAKDKAWLAGEKFAESLPEDQRQTPQQIEEEEAEKFEKLGLMAKFYAEKDEEEKKKIIAKLNEYGLNASEKKLIQTAYSEKGLPSLMDQIG